jgi:hypothetical protein
MKKALLILSLLTVLLTLHPAPRAMAQETAAANPALEKFKADMKAAVLNGSITVDQLKQLQTNAETLKTFKENQRPGAPVDLLTPYQAVSNMRTIMSSVKPQDREILQEDVQALLANQKPRSTSEDPPNAGQKLGKDVFTAVMFGKPTESQVKQLQDGLNGLQQAKTDSGRPLQALMALKRAKDEIEAVMNAGSFRDQDRQAVLDDLNSLGSQNGGGVRRRG